MSIDRDAPRVVPGSPHVPMAAGVDRRPQGYRRDGSDGLNAEVQADQREGEAFEVLDQVIKDPQAFRIRRLLYVEQRADLGRLCRGEQAAAASARAGPSLLGLGALLMSMAFAPQRKCAGCR